LHLSLGGRVTKRERNTNDKIVCVIRVFESIHKKGGGRLSFAQRRFRWDVMTKKGVLKDELVLRGGEFDISEGKEEGGGGSKEPD